MKPRFPGMPLAALLACLSVFPAAAYHAITGGPVVVNGQELSSQQGRGPMQLYGPIAAGDYWYDPFSGLWGPAGGPSTGQIMPGLQLGGALQANASGSGTVTTGDC